MTVIAFDHSGMPVPWQASAPFAFDGERLMNFVDLDGDGRSELLLQHVEEYDLLTKTAASISLYVIHDGSFRRLEGAFAGRRFPIQDPLGIRLEHEPNLTNAVEAIAPRSGTSNSLNTTGNISRIQSPAKTPCWLEGIALSGGGIVLVPDSATVRACEGYLQLGRSGTMPFPLIVVADILNEGRVIDIDHSVDDTLRRVMGLSMGVALVGRSCEGSCRPFIMWARPQ
jgi:hypothetical protein